MRGREINFACTYADKWGQDAGCVQNVKWAHRATNSYGLRITYGPNESANYGSREEADFNESNATTAEESKYCHLKDSTEIAERTTHEFFLYTQGVGGARGLGSNTYYVGGISISSIGRDRISDGTILNWDTVFHEGKVGYRATEGYRFTYYDFWKRVMPGRYNTYVDTYLENSIFGDKETTVWSTWEPRSVKEYHTTLTNTTARIIEENAAVKPFVIKYDNVNNIFHVTTINYDKGYKFVEEDTKFITSAQVNRHTDFSGIPHNLLNVYNTEEAKGIFGTYETITKDQYLFNPAYLFSEGTNNNNYIVYKTVTLTNARDLKIKEAGKPRIENTQHSISIRKYSTLSFRKRSQIEPVTDFLRHDNLRDTYNDQYVQLLTTRVLDEETYYTTESTYLYERYVRRAANRLISEFTGFKENFLQDKHFTTSANYGVSEIYFNSPMNELFTEFKYVYGEYEDMNFTNDSQYYDYLDVYDGEVFIGNAFAGENVNGASYNQFHGYSSEFEGKKRGTFLTHTERYSQSNFDIARIKSIQQYYQDIELNFKSDKFGREPRIWRDKVRNGKPYYSYFASNEPDWSITNVSTFIPRLIYSLSTKEIVENRNTRTETETFNIQIDFGTESTVPGKTYYINKNRKYWSISNGQAIVQTPYDEWEESASAGENFILENKHISYINSGRDTVYGRISNGFMTTQKKYKEVVRQIVYLSQRTTTFGAEPFIETSTEYGSWLRIMNYNLKSSEMTSNANVTSAFNAKYSDRKDAHLWMKMGRYENTAFTIRNTYELAQDEYLSITTRNTSSTMTYHNAKYISGMSANGYNSNYCIGGTDYEGNHISYFINGNIRTEIFSADPNKDMVYETSGELIRNYYSYAWKVSDVETRHNALTLEGSDKTIIRNASPTGVITVTATEMEYDYLFDYNYMSYFNSGYDTLHDEVHSNDRRFQNNCLINDPEKYNALVPKEIIP